MVPLHSHSEHPSYDAIIPAIITHGLQALPEHCKLTAGIPLKPMLAYPTKGIQEVLSRFENAQVTSEWKYDGERAQVGRGGGALVGRGGGAWVGRGGGAWVGLGWVEGEGHGWVEGWGMGG